MNVVLGPCGPGRQRAEWEDGEFEVSLGAIEGLCLTKEKQRLHHLLCSRAGSGLVTESVLCRGLPSEVSVESVTVV